MKTSRPGAWSIVLGLHPDGVSLSEARPGSGALSDSASDEPIDPVDHQILRVWIAEAREAPAAYGLWPALLAVIDRLLEGPLSAADAEVILESLIGEELPRLREELAARSGAAGPWPPPEHFTAEELQLLLALPKLPPSVAFHLSYHLVGGCEVCLPALRAVGPFPEGGPRVTDPVVRALRNTLPERQAQLAPGERRAVRELHEGHPLAFARLLLVEGLRSDRVCLDAAGGVESSEPARELVTAFAVVAVVAPEQLAPHHLADLRFLWCLHLAEIVSWLDPEEAERELVRADGHLGAGTRGLELQASRLEVRARVDAAAGGRLRGHEPRAAAARFSHACHQLRAAADLLATRPELAERRLELLSELGNFLFRGGRPAEARPVLRQALELADVLESRPAGVSQPLVLALRHNLASAELRLAHFSSDPEPGLDEARHHLAAAEPLYDAYGHELLLADRELLIGGIEQLADPPRAEAAYRRAAEMLEGLGVPESAVEARLSLVALLLAQDRAQDAEPVAVEIRRAQRSPKVHLLLARCRQSLAHAAASEAFEATPYAGIARRKLRALAWIFAPEEVDP